MTGRQRLSIAVALACATSARAQQAQPDTLLPLGVAALHAPAIRRQVHASVDSIELATAIRRVASSVGVDLVWDASLAELRRKVTLHTEPLALASVVAALLERAGATAAVEALFSSPATLVLRRARSPDARGGDRPRMVGALEGVVENATTGEPVAGASVHVAAGRGTWTDAAGRFTIRDLPAGLYTLLVRRLGFAPVRIPGIGVAPGARGSLMLIMHPAPAAMSDAVITTATYSAFDDLGRPPAVTREQFATMPQLAEDALRSVARLPGVASEDYGARLHIRGGTGDDVLVTIDGLELIDPFHLRDLGGTVSLVDARTVGMLQLAAGDLGAEYGNRLAGVVAVQSIDPSDGSTRDEVVVDRLHASARSRGTFAGGSGAWLIAARYGFPGRVLRAVDPNNTLHPRYADLFATTRLVAGGDTLAFHVLAAGDRLRGPTSTMDSLSSSTRHFYLWATDRHSLGARGDVRQVLSVGEVRRDRRSAGVSLDSSALAEISGHGIPLDTLPLVVDVRIADARTAVAAAFRQDWRINLAPSWAARFGFEIAHDGAEYDYSRGVGTAKTRLVLEPSTWVAGAHATQRVPIGPSTIAELGTRYDRQTLNGEEAWSPRVHVAHALGEGTTLRLAWGRYAQFERVYELQVEDRDTVLARGDRAEHRGIGVEHALRAGPVFRVEAYEQRQGRIRPRLINPLLGPNPASEVPALAPILLAPLRRRVRGVELSAATAPGRPLSARLGYTYSSAIDYYEHSISPSPFDQRHSVNVETSYTREGVWSIGASWQLRSGWPFTDVTTHLLISGDTLRIRTDYGPVNGARLGTYHRLDLHAERQWLTRRGRLSAYADVFNVYDRRNQATVFSADVEGPSNAPGPIRTGADMVRFLPRSLDDGKVWQMSQV